MSVLGRPMAKGAGVSGGQARTRAAGDPGRLLSGDSNAGKRKRGSGDGMSSSEPSTPPATAIHSAGRRPSMLPSQPPSSAPAGRVP
jgi:hypothetical protein